MNRFILLAVLTLLLPFSGSAQPSATVLGLSSRDKVLAAFWAQNNDANVTMAGLNANATTKLVDGLLPATISGKILTGTFTGTNSFKIETWDAAAAALQDFNFDTTGGVPTNTNTVSRVGFPESIEFKTLEFARLADGGGFLSGILLANGSNYISTITQAAGARTYYWGGTALTFTDGVLTAATGSTNIIGTGITSLNSLGASALQITTNSTGTDFNITTSAGTNISINLPTASATARGAVSASDWTRFNNKQPGDTTLTALAAFNRNGIMVQTGPDSFWSRTIVGTNGVIVINGDGVTGDIIIDTTNSAAAFLSATGDILTYDGLGGTLARLGVGTDGQVLTADSFETLGIKWADPSGGYWMTNSGALFPTDPAVIPYTVPAIINGTTNSVSDVVTWWGFGPTNGEMLLSYRGDLSGTNEMCTFIGNNYPDVNLLATDADGNRAYADINSLNGVATFQLGGIYFGDYYYFTTTSDTSSPDYFAGWNLSSHSLLYSKPLILATVEGDVVLGADQTPADNRGYVVIPAMSGVPTNAPAMAAYGIPIAYDSSSDRLYGYNSGWHDITGITTGGSIWTESGSYLMPTNTSFGFSIASSGSIVLATNTAFPTFLIPSGNGLKATQNGDVLFDAQYNNTLFGVGAGNALTSGAENTALGWESLKSLTTGNYNVALGEAMGTAMVGEKNIAIGRKALIAQDGSESVGIGYLAGTGVSTNAIMLGARTDGPASGTNFIAIGYGAVATNNNDIVIGNQFNTRLIVPITSWSGAGTKAFMDDGTFQTISGVSVNPSSGYMPYNNAGNFADSPLQVDGFGNLYTTVQFQGKAFSQQLGTSSSYAIPVTMVYDQAKSAGFASTGSGSDEHLIELAMAQNSFGANSCYTFIGSGSFAANANSKTLKLYTKSPASSYTDVFTFTTSSSSEGNFWIEARLLPDNVSATAQLLVVKLTTANGSTVASTTTSLNSASGLYKMVIGGITAAASDIVVTSFTSSWFQSN